MLLRLSGAKVLDLKDYKISAIPAQAVALPSELLLRDSVCFWRSRGGLPLPVLVLGPERFHARQGAALSVLTMNQQPDLEQQVLDLRKTALEDFQRSLIHSHCS